VSLTGVEDLTLIKGSGNTIQQYVEGQLSLAIKHDSNSGKTYLNSAPKNAGKTFTAIN
jgi:hypothetical protein